MKNTDFNLDFLQNAISSDFSFDSLAGFIDDFGLEVVSVARF